MKHPLYLAGLALVAVIAIGLTVYAQELETGTWSGTLTPPGDAAMDITYDVSYDEGELSITINIPEMGGSLSASDISVDGETLSFSFAPGPQVDCDLQRQEDGSFAGDCSPGGGESGHMTMVAPS